MSDNSRHEHFANFAFCKFCEYKNKAESDEPCCDCLDYPTNIESHRPIHFKDNGSLAKALKIAKELTSKGE